jgi:hypothetical protein
VQQPHQNARGVPFVIYARPKRANTTRHAGTPGGSALFKIRHWASGRTKTISDWKRNAILGGRVDGNSSEILDRRAYNRRKNHGRFE